MLTIEVFGTTPPCAKCKRAEREALKAAEMAAERGLGEPIEVLKRDALGPEAAAYDILLTPAVVVAGTLVSSGKVVPASVLVEHLLALH